MSETRGEAAMRLGYGSYDTSLPQRFFDTMMEILRNMGVDVINPSAHFVWGYSDKNGSYTFGIPGPLTETGKRGLEVYNS